MLWQRGKKHAKHAKLQLCTVHLGSYRTNPNIASGSCFATRPALH